MNLQKDMIESYREVVKMNKLLVIGSSQELLNPIFFKIGDIEIRWYAICILVGAFLAYFVTQYFAKKAGYKKEMLENFFFLILPVGVLGAKAWYVLSNLNTLPLYHIFFIWEPGLAIQGGVMAGFIVGIFYFKKFYKDINLNFLADLILPNILIAQSIGRWGNFMNREVVGACVEQNIWWAQFLPRFVVVQMTDYGGMYGIGCSLHQMAIPLFLVESILTLVGFFVITFVLRTYWKSRKKGDLASLYFVYYGVIRFILEPMRQPAYIMSIFGIPTSMLTSALFVLGGLAYMTYLRRDDIVKARKKIHE